MTGLVQAGVQLVPGKTFGWPKFPRFRCHSVKEKIYGVYTKATVAFCLEQPSLRAALRSRESSSVLGAQQSPRARPALPPAAPQHLSNAGPRVLSIRTPGTCARADSASSDLPGEQSAPR